MAAKSDYTESETRTEANMSTPLKNPGNAAVLSFILPGIGQIYNGDFLRGIFWLIITPGLWVGSGGTLGWLCHLIAAYTAYQRAETKNRRLE
jgi:TM2 domain-containing membrane protein YozV